MSADLLTRLIEAGTPAALVAEVAMLAARADAQIEAAMQPTAGALRMRRMRERNAASQSVTCDASDARVTEGVTETSPSPPPLLPPQTPPTTPPPLPHPEEITTGTRKARAGAWPCPDGVDPQHWADVMANRKSKRLANTPTAHKAILRDLAKLSDDEWPPGRIVQHAAERGWGAIFDPRSQNGNRNGQRPHQNGRSGNGFLDAVIDAERDDRARPRL